ncbi:MAG: signal peptidase I, partial [Candidatus Scatosoma sp.]
MKKTLKIIQRVLTCVVVAVAVVMMVFTVISATTVDRDDKKLFGVKIFKVLSDSMSATDFSAGDVIFVKDVDPQTLKEEDIISYTSQNPESFGEVITHKIRELTKDKNGDPGFVTYGTTTGANDAVVVTYAFVIGKYVGRIPKLGYFLDFLKTTPGFIVCILVPFMLLIISQGITCIRLFRQYKAGQKAEMEEEKARIAADKEETQRMMAELLALKAQMEAQRNP